MYRRTIKLHPGGSTKDAFYAKLQEALEKIPKSDVVVMMGDFNSNVGQSDSPESAAIVPRGLGERNELGDRLVDFATANEMVIANTLFKQHRRQLYTWTSPDGNTRNQIDYFCIQKRWKTSVVNSKILPGAIVDEMMPIELWEKIKITTAKVTKEKLLRKRFRKKQWISEETL